MAEYTREQLVSAFQRADEAGDTEAATELARRIRVMDGSAPAPATSTSPRTQLTQSPLFERPPAPVDPMEPYRQTVSGMTPLEQFSAGAGSAIGRPIRGIREITGSITPEESARAEMADQALMESGYGFTGNLFGNVAGIVGPGAALKVAANVPRLAGSAATLSNASRAFLPTTISGAAAQGGVVGGLQPTGEGGNEARAINALTGTVASGAGLAFPQAVGGTLRWASRGNEGQVADYLRANIQNADEVFASGVPSRVPGVTRTALEETLNPDVANLDRLTRSRGNVALTEAERANARARASELQRIAGTEQELLDAIARRTSESGPLRREAMRAQNIDVTRALSNLSRLEKAYEGTPTIQGPIREVKELLGQVSRGGQADMRQLYNVRKEIGYMISGASPTTTQGQSIARELIAAREAIDRVVARRVPEFRQYLDTFQQLSGDVNRLQFGQELLRVATTDGGEGVGRLVKPGQFIARTEGLTSINPRASANALAQQATQFRRARASSVLPQEDVDAILALRDDYIRANQAGAVAAGNAGRNSQTALQQNLIQIVRQKVMDNTVAGRAIQMLSNDAQDRVLKSVADALANPNQARAILSRFPANERRIAQQTFNALGISTAAQAAAATPLN